MTKRKKLLAPIIILALLLVFGIVFILTQQTDKKQPSNPVKTTTKQKASHSETAKNPEGPTGGSIDKNACDLLDSKLAIKTVGEGAVKNDKLTTFRTADYKSTSCEYAANNKKVSVTLYEYLSAEKAEADKTNAETKQMVVTDGGKTTSLQPKSSVAEVKGKFVVTVTVTVTDKFDSDSSGQLLKDIIAKLR